jgi:type I restriction enzyme S subunit
MMFEKYDASKDSGVEWLRDVPKHWEIVRIKSLSLVRRGASPRPIDAPKYFSENGEYAWVRIADVTASNHYLTETKEKLSKLGNSYSVKILPGQLFLSIAGSVGKPIISRIKCCIHDGFVYFPFLKIDNEFLYRVFECGTPFIGLGKHGTQLNLNTETVGNIKIALPPQNEQLAIVNFLDRKTLEIDQLIEIKEQQIALLNERKQIVIQKAVTQGLDPNVLMKDSGVEWIGKIPEHWSINKLSYVAKLDSGSTPDRSNMRFWNNGTIPWLKTGEINYNLITQAEEFVTPLALSKSALKLAPKGTVLMAMYGQGITRGRVAILDIDATYNQACCAIQCKNKLFNKYLFQFFSFAYQFIRDGGNETSQMNISTGYISNLKVLVPPLNEQEQIVNYLVLELQKFSDLKALLKQEIEKLKEYKTTLINDAVTGKIKVAKKIKPSELWLARFF